MRSRSGATRLQRAIVYVVFVLVAIVALDVPLYNRVDPAWFGIPFFYWFQVIWILIAAAATVAAYRLGV